MAGPSTVNRFEGQVFEGADVCYNRYIPVRGPHMQLLGSLKKISERRNQKDYRKRINRTCGTDLECERHSKRFALLECKCDYNYSLSSESI